MRRQDTDGGDDDPVLIWWEAIGRRGTSTTDGKSGTFYAKDGVVACTDLGWLQSAFDLLAGLFDNVDCRQTSTRSWA